VELKSLVVNVFPYYFPNDPPKSCCPADVGLTGDHPLFRWMDGIEGLRNTGREYHFHEFGESMCFLCRFAVGMGKIFLTG